MKERNMFRGIQKELKSMKSQALGVGRVRIRASCERSDSGNRTKLGGVRSGAIQKAGRWS